MKKGIKTSVITLGILAMSWAYVSAGYFNSAPLYTCDAGISRTLRVGSENEEVYTLQTLLVQKGYLHVSPNGYFGPATRQAVSSFQRDNGLSATGIVTESTRSLLNATCGFSSSYSYSSYPYSNYTYSGTGVTYVDAYDPYVRVISPQVTTPAVYTTANNTNVVLDSFVTSPYTATPSSQGQVTGIVYSPSLGYTYSIVPVPGILTISSPSANAVYKEGDTVYVSWGTSNLQVNSFEVYLENTSSGQKKVVAVTSGNNISFVLTKDLLDQVCSGTCSQSYSQGSFKVVIATPVTDMAGVSSVFRAQVTPITINRPYAYFGVVSITSSKTPVTSGEPFKLYINIPTGASWNTTMYGNYSIKVRALCPTGVDVKIAGVPCGQEFVLPYAPSYFQQEIPAVITNPTWYPQGVTFELTVTNLLGQVIGQAQTKVIGNAAPFSW